MKSEVSAVDRFWAKVDITATCWLWTAYRNPDGYGKFKYEGQPRLAHRISYEWANGTIPAGMMLDHICHTRACVNPSHLRPVTNKQNQENPPGPPRTNSTGALGVYRKKRDGRYQARVVHNGRTTNAGTFTTLEEAAEAARQLRLLLFTHNELDRKTA